MLEQADGLRATAELYRAAVGFDVCFRPTDKGVTALALDPTAPASVGVGALRAWMPPRVEVEAQLVTYRAKRAQMRRMSREEQASLRLIKGALAGGLRLPEGLLFVCREWRFPILGGGSGKLDLLAVDPARRALVVIELKSTVGSRGRARPRSRLSATRAGCTRAGSCSSRSSLGCCERWRLPMAPRNRSRRWRSTSRLDPQHV